MFTSSIIFALAGASLQLPSVQKWWPTFVAAHGDTCWLTVFVPWAIGVVVYWSFGLMMLAVEINRWPLIVFGRKIQPSVTLQLRGSVLQPPLLRCCCVVLFNQCFVMLPTLLVIVRPPCLIFALHCDSRPGQHLPALHWHTRRAAAAFAPAHGACSSLLFFMLLLLLCELLRVQVRDAAASGVLVEVLFYTSHRLLHSGPLYRFHKLHHAYKAPIALAALYAHPLEAMLGNTIAVMAPAYIAGIHSYSWMWGVALGFVSTQAHHCGFNLDGVAHDRHHQYSNVEFGHLGFMDYL